MGSRPSEGLLDESDPSVEGLTIQVDSHAVESSKGAPILALF